MLPHCTESTADCGMCTCKYSYTCNSLAPARHPFACTVVPAMVISGQHNVGQCSAS